jgi:hypothetical protein
MGRLRKQEYNEENAERLDETGASVEKERYFGWTNRGRDISLYNNTHTGIEERCTNMLHNTIRMTTINSRPKPGRQSSITHVQYHETSSFVQSVCIQLPLQITL